jgi:hypothetical protein
MYIMSDRKLLTIREFLRAESQGAFKASDVSTQCAAGWYDWFCRDHLLVDKTAKLTGLLRSICLSKKINLDSSYVFFKNNCPMVGKLYDQFSICDIETGDVLFCVIPSCGHTRTSGEAQVYARSNGFEEPVAKGNWNDVVAYFNEV